MKELLKELYYMLEPEVKVKGRSWKIINRAENKLCKKLKGKDKKLFSDYELAYSEYTAVIAVESFKQGFKRGMQFEQELSEI